MSLIRGDGGGALDIPSDQIFNSNAERDTFFTNNPAKLVEGAQCVVLTSPPEGLYQVYTSGSWENRSAIIQGPQGPKGDAGGLDFTNLSPNTVPIVNGTADDLINSGITETATNIVVNKTLIVPQESLLIGPAVKLSDKGGYLGVSNIAEDTRGFGIVSKTYETEAQRDLEFADGVPRIDYQYLVPAKWVYQFPFEDITSDDNLLSFEFQDSDNTFIRKLRLFSTTALTGVRVWIENVLPSGDALVWENVTPEDQEGGQGLTLNASGFTELDTGFIKISTSNIKFRFSIQAMTGEKLKIIGSSLNLGFGTGFYPKMYTYTQDSIKTQLLDGIDTAHNRFGEFGNELRLDSDKVIVRQMINASDTVLQPDFSVLVPNDRPDIVETNGNQPIVLNSITVKHQGTWGPVQVSFSDLRTKVVNLVDGDNTITIDGKPLVIEANEDYYIRFTGAVGTGSKSQISLLGNSSGKPYASINTTGIKEKNLSDGSQDVVDLDVSSDSTVTLDNSYIGKFVNIVQTGSPAAIPMRITLSDHGQFSTGDVIKIGTEISYVNYYYAVYYNNSQGASLVAYPSRLQGIELVRTDGGWDVSLDGTYNKVAVRPKAKSGIPFADNDPDVRPVQAFSFIEHPAVNYIEDEDGNRAVEVDLNKIINVSPDTVDIVGWWSGNASPDASDITNALGQVQSNTLISHTDNVKSDELPETNIAMRREETSPKYTYFAYPTGFFTDKDGTQIEPTLVNTGVGNSSDWVVSTVDVDGVTYRIQRSPAQNVSQQLLTCKLIQEGY